MCFLMVIVGLAPVLHTPHLFCCLLARARTHTLCACVPWLATEACQALSHDCNEDAVPYPWDALIAERAQEAVQSRLQPWGLGWLAPLLPTRWMLARASL